MVVVVVVMARVVVKLKKLVVKGVLKMVVTLAMFAQVNQLLELVL